MQHQELAPDAPVIWHCQPSAPNGAAFEVPATVVRLSPTHVRIRYRVDGGPLQRRWVWPEHLTPASRQAADRWSELDENPFPLRTASARRRLD